jgi:hypothetical protein
MENSNKYDAAWLDEKDEFLQGLRQEIQALKERGIFEGKKIAIVGSWSRAREIKDIIENLNLELSIIADNNPNKQNVPTLGIITQSVESLMQENEIIILVINNYAWRDLKNQLTMLGFAENINFFVLFGGEKSENEQGVNELIVPDAEWDRCKIRAIKGYEAYCEIYEKYNHKPIWLMHQPSLGDLYIFSLFLPQAMRVESISECDCILIVTKNSVKKLAGILGFRYIEMITYEEADKNWLTMMKMMDEKVDVHNAVFHGVKLLLGSLVNFSTVNFKDSFTKYVLRLPDDAKPIYPSFPRRTDVVKKIFDDYGLIPHKTVLISPYAGHFIASITKLQWKRLVDELQKKGYSVCTNSGGKNEPALEGTVAPFIDLQDCVEFVEMAGFFIGVRSGFCDLICKAECTKMIIYETGALAGSADFFGFESMGLGENIKEYVNDCINTDDMIDSILKNF